MVLGLRGLRLSQPLDEFHACARQGLLRGAVRVRVRVKVKVRLGLG